MKPLLEFISKLKGICGNSPIIKLILAAFTILGISSTVVWSLTKICNENLLPILPLTVNFLTILVLISICIVPPKYNSKKTVVCLMLNMQSMRDSFSYGDSAILPQLSDKLKDYNVKTVNYFKSVFYNIILSSSHEDNFFKDIFKKWFFQRCKAQLIIIGNASIKEQNKNDFFECYCNIILNPKCKNDKLKSVEEIIDRYGTVLLRFKTNSLEERNHAISNLASIITILISYNPGEINTDIVSKISGILEEMKNENNPYLQKNLSSLIVWLIIEISSNYPQVALNKDFIELCENYLKITKSVAVFNNKNFYKMSKFLNSKASTITTIKEYAKQTLKEMEFYDSSDGAFLINKAFLNLILDKIPEAEELYIQAFSTQDFEKNAGIDSWGFYQEYINHDLIGLYVCYAKAFYILANKSGSDYLCMSSVLFKAVYNNAKKGSSLRNYAKKHKDEISAKKKEKQLIFK